MRNAVASEVAALAAGQWGLVTAAQASASGISRMQLTRMVNAGLLDRVMHGVYATPGVQGDQHLTLRAAWLTLEPEAAAEARMANLPATGVVSHASAAQLLGLGDLVADEHEFTVARRHQSTRAGVRVRRAVLNPGEVTFVDGLPVTTAARTVADLLMIGHELEHVAAVVADALRRDLTDALTLEAALAPAARRHDARDGAELLIRLLDLAGMGLEDLERRVLDNDLGRELVRKAAGSSYAQSVSTLAEVPGMLAALESVAETLRVAMDSPAMREIAARMYDATRVVSGSGMQAAAHLANSPGMRAALDAVGRAQGLYDSPGMRAALDAVGRAQGLPNSPAALPPARAASQVASSASWEQGIERSANEDLESLELPSAKREAE